MWSQYLYAAHSYATFWTEDKSQWKREDKLVCVIISSSSFSADAGGLQRKFKAIKWSKTSLIASAPPVA